MAKRELPSMPFGKGVGQGSKEWPTRFGVLLNQIWIRRNNFIFDGVLWGDDSKCSILLAEKLMQEIELYVMDRFLKHLIRWRVVALYVTLRAGI